MAPPGVSVPLRFLREVQKGVSQLRSRIQSSVSRNATSASGSLQVALVHAHDSSSSTLRRIKVAKRWYTTAYRTILHNAAINPNPPTQGTSRILGAVSNMTKTAPFATSLRPKLTGGAFPRTASGYSSGSGAATGARFFSHSPAAPAEVIHQVSQAFRAMAKSGGDRVTEYQRYKNQRNASVSAYLSAQLAQNGAAPSAHVDFYMPFSLSRMGFTSTLNAEHLGYGMTVMSELTKLASLGNLPVTFKEDTIRVHFAGCERETVKKLCDDVGMILGVIGEEEPFAYWLLMPTPAPCARQCVVLPPERVTQTALDWEDMLSESADHCLSEEEELTEEGTQYTPTVSLLGSLCSASMVSRLPPEQPSSEESIWLSDFRSSHGGLNTPGNLSSKGSMRSGFSGQKSPKRCIEPTTSPQTCALDMDFEGLRRFLAGCEAHSRGERPVWD